MFSQKRRLYDVSAVQAGLCVSSASFNRCNGASTYSCVSCHEQWAGKSCPDSTNYGCTTGSTCWNALYSNIWPTTTYTYTHDPADLTVYSIGSNA